MQTCSLGYGRQCTYVLVGVQRPPTPERLVLPDAEELLQVVSKVWPNGGQPNAPHRGPQVAGDGTAYDHP
jgi:hypothetical protein